MFNFARTRLTYANVAATLALVFSMTGGALAAKHYLINSTRQINPKVLKKLKARLKGKTGARGPAGAPGPEGPPGAARASSAFNATSSSDLFNFPSTPNETATVYSLSLPAGNFSVLGKLIAMLPTPGSTGVSPLLTLASSSNISILLLMSDTPLV